jgi:hypothetical protein
MIRLLRLETGAHTGLCRRAKTAKANSEANPRFIPNFQYDLPLRPSAILIAAKLPQGTKTQARLDAGMVFAASRRVRHFPSE